MGVLVRFRAPSGLISLDLGRISSFEITRQRNTCELLAITPENPRKDTPYAIAKRDKEWQLKNILADLQRLKGEPGDIIFEITDTDCCLVKKP